MEQYTGNPRAQYRHCMSSTPETGRLACTSVVSRFGAALGNTPMALRAQKSPPKVFGIAIVAETGRRVGVRVQYLVI